MGRWTVQLIPLLFLISCNGSDPVCERVVRAQDLAHVDAVQLKTDVAAVESYLTTRGISAQREDHGVQYVVTEQGSSPEIPCLASEVYFTYKGRLMTTGVAFDSATTVTHYKLNTLLLGWRLVFPKLSKGTAVTIYIPSGFAYGAADVRDNQGDVIVPGNSNVIYDVRLTDIR